MTAVWHDPAGASKPAAGLLPGCTLKMTAPEPHEWETFWDATTVRTATPHPSDVRVLDERSPIACAIARRPAA